ncbi:MAG: hypothetical protein FJ399_07790 [Verrucomicrobia bacterium]|nr:hypothetical protein [Verrucomicrobiota bacterium]
MNTRRLLHVLPLLPACVCLAGPLSPPTALPAAHEVRRNFAQPPREYSTAPLWVWNDLLTESQVRETLRDLAAQAVRQVFVHPRPGLMTPYLSPEWFRLWRVALEEAARLDLNVWIYDENSYPSGFAGGWVPEQMPESRGRGLDLRVVSEAPLWTPETLAVYRLEEGAAVDVSAAARRAALPPQGRYLAATIQRTANRAWTADRSYVDLLHPGVTGKFLEVTLEAYRREVGPEFGRRIPGVFTDEPHLRPAGSLHWSDDLPQTFQERRGYSLLAHLPSLSQEVGDWRRVRHDYFQVLNALFIERWAKPYFEWCENNRLAFTGHYWEHQWPNCNGVPSNMAMAAWQHIPGIDCLMNQYREDTGAQFGNIRMVRELASVANQLGRRRTLCEIYGAAGWELRFEDMKRIADWLAVLGVNFFDEHLSFATLRGARKRDHPQSFSYHEPWWDSYHVIARYLTRLSFALAQGEQRHRILVLEPTTTAWMYQGHAARLKEIGESFFHLLKALEAAQVEYDLADEDILARHGAAAGAELRVGRRQYTTFVLPAGTENLAASTVTLLEGFLRTGGTVLALGEPPPRVEGAVSPAAATLASHRTWQQIPAPDLPARLGALPAPDAFIIRRNPDDRGILFHHRRHLADGQLLFLVNTSAEHPSSGLVEIALPGVEIWDLDTGQTRPAAFARTTGGIRTRFDLPPSGSLLLFLAQRALPSAPAPTETRTTLAARGPLQVRRTAPNVLTLDHVDLTAGGETKANLYCYAANQLAFQKNGLARNPWDSAVQFRDDLIKQKFAADSGFSATYRFALAIERPDLYRVACNGQPVAAPPGAWWLDKAFGRIPIASAARVGENFVTITAAPFTLSHELEPAYLLGDFSLEATARGFVVAPPQPLQPGRWNEQGLPFYGHGVTYEAEFDLAARSGRYAVGLGAWHGSVARVRVNGREACVIHAPPWERDVTAHLQNGRNVIAVEVIGTLRNTLGPHHGNPPAGSAWPRMFQVAPTGGLPPGAQYSTIGYGLLAPFELRQIRTLP